MPSPSPSGVEHAPLSPSDPIRGSRNDDIIINWMLGSTPKKRHYAVSDNDFYIVFEIARFFYEQIVNFIIFLKADTLCPYIHLINTHKIKLF